MQDRYVGDIGDFGKYALLRALTGCYPKAHKQHSLGIVWHKTVPDTKEEREKKDGGRIGYLKEENSELSKLDQELFASLKLIVTRGNRSIKAVEESNIFSSNPSNAFFDTSLNAISREDWLAAALEKTKDCDIVFVDPDKGLNPDSIKKHLKKAIPYVFADELSKFAERKNQSLIILHHPWHEKNDVHIKKMLDKHLRKIFSGNLIYAIRYHRTTSIAYFVIIPPQQLIIRDRMERFLLKWEKHFKRILLPK